MQHYYAFVYVRIMQALGAYGFRGFYERKAHFLQSVPLCAEEPALAAAACRAAHRAARADGRVQEHCGLRRNCWDWRRNRTSTAPRTRARATGAASQAEKLVVRIFSFSFHRGGPPKDETGHGGGFVFDARSLPNPGREERFKTLTGKDAPVIEYLNQQESVHQYLANATSLVDASISNYQSRGFKNLMVSFGCTGGQHRSVYLAEQLAKHLRGGRRSGGRAAALELEKMELEKMTGEAGR